MEENMIKDDVQEDNTEVSQEFDSGFPEADIGQADTGLSGIPEMEMGGLDMGLDF